LGQQGFTLLETLVALVVAATAAAVISAFLRGIVARVEKEQLHQLAVMQLMNKTALLQAAPLMDARWVYDKDVLRLLSTYPELPEVEVRNYSPEDGSTGIPLPPIDLAFTPYQRLSVQVDRYTLQFLRPALPSPARRAGAADVSVSAAAAAAGSIAAAPLPKPEPATTQPGPASIAGPATTPEGAGQ
jgi:prepilin-type N-terminal cleavage/methylation domain-containing protein